MRLIINQNKGGDKMPRATKTTTTTTATNNTDYIKNGVSISPAVPAVGDKVKILYDGLLSKSGATHVYAHLGYGGNWAYSQDIPMTRTYSGFEASIPVSETDRLNVCFKDCANNWDNNSGLNYTFDVVD
jgi:hypothetical protein